MYLYIYIYIYVYLYIYIYIYTYVYVYIYMISCNSIANMLLLLRSYQIVRKTLNCYIAHYISYI